MKAVKQFTKKALSLLLCFAMMMSLVTVTGLTALGSSDIFNPDGSYRFYSEFFIPTYKADGSINRDGTYAGIKRQTIIQCFLNKGETAYFGSSVYDSRLDASHALKSSATGVDIVMTKPDGTIEAFDVINGGAGHIGNRSQEVGGPKITPEDENNVSKYVPLKYKAPSTGIYEFAFHSQTGEIATPTAQSVTGAFSGQKACSVAAWDITVVNQQGEVRDGRTWTNHMAMSTGAAGSTRANLNAYVLTNDGYIYEVNFKDIIPFGFVFFANNQGFTTTGLTPYSIYHSFYDDDNNMLNIDTEELVSVHMPYAQDTETAHTYKLFFEKPNEDLIGKVYNEPIPVQEISDITFHGHVLGTSRYGQGGEFTFQSAGATSATITIDFREPLEELKNSKKVPASVKDYKGSGIVELSGAVADGENTFYWDGLDTDGLVVPVGVYGKSSVHAASKAKGGEVHFPLLDVEGLFGGVTIKRLNGKDCDEDADVRYDLYYNNNPLVYGTIEPSNLTAEEAKAAHDANGDNSKLFYQLSDGTLSRSYWGLDSDPIMGSKYFCTVDGKRIKPTNISTLIEDSAQYLYELETGKDWNALTPEQQAAETEKYAAYATSYHHEPVCSRNPEDSILFSNYGANYGGGNQGGIDIWTYYTSGAKVARLSTDMAILDAENAGTVSGRVFYDENKDAKYAVANQDILLKDVEVSLVDKDGNVISHVERVPDFTSDGYFKRDENGEVIFTEKTVTYTTKTNSFGSFKFTSVPIDPEGSTYYVKVNLSEVQLKVQKYALTTTSVNAAKNSGPDGNNADQKFSLSRSQSVTLTADQTDGIFKDIGYTTGTPAANQMDYKVVKQWPEDGTRPLENVTMRLYYLDDEKNADTSGSSGHGHNSRTGVLVDTVKLEANNDWSHTWKHLDKTLQYYIIEYYTKTDDDGVPIINDRGEERLVLIGGTMPIYSSEPNIGEEKYDFLHENETKYRDKEYFGDGITHYDATTDREKQSTIDNDALLYNVTYTLTYNVNTKTNIITINNSQTYDEREYYTWLDHESVLPNLVVETHGNKVSESGSKTFDVEVLSANPDQTIKGLVVTTLDADKNEYGDATGMFRYNPGDSTHTSVLYMPTTHGDYPEGTGTRTYDAEYTNAKGETHNFTITIHVYDLGEDTYVFDYGLPATLQTPIVAGEAPEQEYMLLSNDVLRVPLYKNEVNGGTMHSCADLVGIAYSPNGVVSDDDAAALTWVDTKNATDASKDGHAEVQGKNGIFSVDLTKSRNLKSAIGDDHANYASATFRPTSIMSNVDVFYYKVIIFSESYTYRNLQYNDIDATKGVIMYVPVRIMPASVVYYEDGYRFSTEYSADNFEIVDDGINPETPETAFQSINPEVPYGYDNAYIDAEGSNAGLVDSLGSSTNVAGQGSKFSFTFTGTGFDIIGRTDDEAARITYRIDRIVEGKKKLYKGGTVDASYVDKNEGTALYQLPVVSVKGMARDTYVVTATLSTSSTGKYHFNFDGIRIYNPLSAEDTAYYSDAECGAKINPIRSMVLGSVTEAQLEAGYLPTNAKVAIIYAEKNNGSYVYGSTVTEVRTASSVVNHSEKLADYLASGPKGELYLPSGCGIAFNAKGDTTPANNTLQIEAKAIYDGDVSSYVNSGYGALEVVGANTTISLESSTAMYYTLPTDHLSANGNMMVLVNNSGHTVSLTNIKANGYYIAFPTDFVKTSATVDTQVSSSTPDETWTTGKSAIADEVRVSSAEFTTSYARAGRDIILNVTIVEPDTVKEGEIPQSAYKPVLFDKNGNAVTLADADIIPLRDRQTSYTVLDENGETVVKPGRAFVYRLTLTAPTDDTTMEYTVGAVSRSETTIGETTGTFYSSNGWNVFVNVKPALMAISVDLESVGAGTLVRAFIVSEEPITVAGSGWTQATTMSVCSDYSEDGEYAVIVRDADGYDQLVTFCVNMQEVKTSASLKETFTVNDRILEFVEKLLRWLMNLLFHFDN